MTSLFYNTLELSEMIKTDKKGKLAQFKANEKVVRAILNEWAPIGAGTPEDEYDCLVHRVLSVLDRGSILDLKATLQEELFEHFGSTGVPQEEFNQVATKIWTWWSNQETK
jgi:hypothetical protein